MRSSLKVLTLPTDLAFDHGLVGPLSLHFSSLVSGSSYSSLKDLQPSKLKDPKINAFRSTHIMHSLSVGCGGD